MSAAGHIGVKLESVVGAIRDRLDIARFLSEFISEGKSFASSTTSARRGTKKRRGTERGEKNNFETNFKFYDRVSLEQVALSWRDKRRRKLAEDLAIKAIWIDSLVDSEGESELEMNSRATFFSVLLPADK